MSKARMIEELVATGVWGPDDAKRGLAANFSCLYCDKDLLGSVDNYKEWQTDHLVPSSAGGPDEEDNYVVCCKTCNFIKGRWNPILVCDGDNPSRDALIDAARKYIIEKREYNAQMLEEFVAIIERY